jgi:membrane-bound metal-dependent hydrolase YbcI (DUF457 family)
MNTPSHFLITAALRQGFRRSPIATSAWLFGAVAPDIALYALSIGGALYYRALLGWSPNATWSHLFGTLYFQHPLWIASHNLLHSPTLLLPAVLGLWRFRWRQGTTLHGWFWFLLACLLHSMVDMLTHVDDGPVLFFPFEWTMRFQSPVSYWDSRHYGAEFAVFELTLDLLLVGYVVLPRVGPWLRMRLTQGAALKRAHTTSNVQEYE